ncbi:transcriptional repressor LexA [Roseateles sp. BYS180W]|uniref:LexA repressor n=1 Tax=Roseateles rivi TaxID=3299028 RepID=A0ABW7FY74_9BURK
MDNKTKLTPRQQEILDLVRRSIETTGAPPTRAEIAAQLGFRSANAAEEHLQALARKGVLELVGGTSRGIRLKADTLQQLHRARQQVQSKFSPLQAISDALPCVLPLVGRVAAGHPILAQEHVEQHVAVQAHLFSAQPDYLLRVKGLSMKDAGILDGDLLAVRQTREARNGQIVVARLGDEVTVKRWRRQGQRIELLPENPDFEPIIVQADRDDITIEGIAVGLIRNQFGL